MRLNASKRPTVEFHLFHPILLFIIMYNQPFAPHHPEDPNRPHGKKPLKTLSTDELGKLAKPKAERRKLNMEQPKKSNQITFENFLQFFPYVELPYTITSETQRLISRKNDPLSVAWLYAFVLGKDREVDEYTEFMPCFSIPETHGFWAVVYWEAALEGTTYWLTTFSKAGILIDQKKIAGTKYSGDGLYQMVCTISESWMFSSAEGKLDAAGNTVAVSSDSTHSHTALQLTGDGEIVAI